MKRLLGNLALLVAILLLIKLPFAFFYRSALDVRVEQFDQEQFDTVFVGSSRTQNSILPHVFDDRTRGRTKSYNLGISGAMPPQTFEWCRVIIETKPSLRYVFFELSGGMDAFLQHDFLLQPVSLSDYSSALSTLTFANSSIYTDKLILSALKPEITREESDAVQRTPPSDGQLQRSAAWHKRVETGDETAVVDERYWRHIEDLISAADSKGVRIYFFIPPRIESESEAEILYPIYRRLDEKYKIRAAHDDEFLHRPETSSDYYHLNNEGALWFTNSFADAFLVRLND